MGTWIRQNLPPRFLTQQAPGLALEIRRATGWALCAAVTTIYWGCRIVYAVSQVLWLGFLLWQDRGLYSILGRALSSLPCQGRRTEQAPRCVWLIYCGHNSAELLPGQTGPPSSALQMGRATGCHAYLLAPARRMLSAKVWARVAVNSTPTPPSQSDPQGSNLTDFPCDPCEARPRWALQETSHNAGKARCSSWALLFFPPEKPSARGEGKKRAASQRIPVLACGWVTPSEWNCSSYPSNAIPFQSLCSGGKGDASTLSPHPGFSSGVLPVDSC